MEAPRAPLDAEWTAERETILAELERHLGRELDVARSRPLPRSLPPEPEPSRLDLDWSPAGRWEPDPLFELFERNRSVRTRRETR